LEVFLTFCPGLAEKYIEMIFLNIDIWINAKKEVHDTIITKLSVIMDTKAKLLNMDKIVDSLLNCIEICAYKTEDLSKFIQKLSEVVIKICKNFLNDAILSKLISYANIFYIRRNPKYPILLFYVLRILLDLFINSKVILFKEIRESMKKKKINKVITSLIVIIDYMITSEYLVECIFCFSEESVEKRLYPGITTSLSRRDKNEEEKLYDSKNDPLNVFSNNEGGLAIIDSIQAMAIYMIISFDWMSLVDYLKDLPKDDLYVIPSSTVTSEEAESSSEKRNIDAVGFILKYLGKSNNKNPRTLF